MAPLCVLVNVFIDKIIRIVYATQKCRLASLQRLEIVTGDMKISVLIQVDSCEHTGHFVRKLTDI